MLSKLPIEIMDKIYGYLDQEEKLNLAKVSQQLGSIYAYHARDTYKNLFCSNYKDDELKVILPLCGSIVFELEIGYAHVKNANSIDEIFKLIAKHCVNLESARVFIRPLNFNSCKYLLAIKGLINIRLDFWTENYQESDLLQYINPDCKVLTVVDISDYQAQNIRQLINLEELVVLRPKEGQDLRNIFSIGSNLIKLRVLHLYGCTHSPAFHEQVNEYPELEKLYLFDCAIHAVLPKCPKITYLELIIRSNTTFYDIVDTIARYGSTLEQLIIEISAFGRNTLNGKQFIKALRECTKLKRLGATFDLTKVLFNECLQSFIDMLKERGFNKERRFVMNFNEGFRMKPYLVQESETADSEVWNLITLDE